jgi:hypothetical protein
MMDHEIGRAPEYAHVQPADNCLLNVPGRCLTTYHALYRFCKFITLKKQKSMYGDIENWRAWPGKWLAKARFCPFGPPTEKICKMKHEGSQ